MYMITKEEHTKCLVAQNADSAICGFFMVPGDEPRTANPAVRATSKLNERSVNVYENKG